MSANAGAIRAGKAYVEAMLNDTHLRKGLLAMEARLKAFKQNVSAVGNALMGMGTAIAAPMLAAAKIWADAGSALQDMSQRTGVSAESLSALGYAAEQSGTTLEAVEGGLRKMAKGVAAAGTGSKGAVEDLARLGLTFADLQGLSPDQQFKLFADRIDAIGDPTQKAALAMAIFGKSATDLFPMMTGGAAGIEALEQRARDLGIVMSNESAAAAEQFRDAMSELAMVAKSAAMALATAVAPALQAAMGDLQDNIRGARDWIKEHQSLVTLAVKAVPALIGVGAAFKAAAAAAGVAQIAVKAFTMAAAPLSAGTFMAWAAGMVAVAAAAAVLGEGYDTVKVAAESALEAGDRQRDADQKRIGRLQQLAAQEKLTANQTGEAKAIIAELTKSYGDLGLSIDQTTGKITGMTGAQAKLNEEMRAAAIAQADAAAAEHEANANALLERSSGVMANWKADYLGGETPEQLRAQAQSQWQQAQAAMQRSRALKKGDTAALTSGGQPAKPAGTAGADPEWDAIEKRKDLEAKAQEDLAAARRASIQDEYLRELTTIQAAYQKKIEAAEGASSAIATLEQARAQEIANLEAKLAAETAKDDAAAAKEQAKKAEEQAAARQDAERDMERQTIEATMQGRAKELALLELDRKAALEEAKKTGIPEEQVNRLYGAKAAALGADIKQEQSTGTFSGEAAGQLGPSNTAQRIAAAAESQLDTLIDVQRILRRIEQADGGLTVQ